MTSISSFLPLLFSYLTVDPCIYLLWVLFSESFHFSYPYWIKGKNVNSKISLSNFNTIFVRFINHLILSFTNTSPWLSSIGYINLISLLTVLWYLFFFSSCHWKFHFWLWSLQVSFSVSSHSIERKTIWFGWTTQKNESKERREHDQKVMVEVNISVFMDKRSLGHDDNLFVGYLQVNSRPPGEWQHVDTLMKNLGITKCMCRWACTKFSA